MKKDFNRKHSAFYNVSIGVEILSVASAIEKNIAVIRGYNRSLNDWFFNQYTIKPLYNKLYIFKNYCKIVLNC